MFDARGIIQIAAIFLATFACVTDIRTRRISNALVLAGLGLGLALNLWAGGFRGMGLSLAGGGLGLLLFLPFFALGGMGGGDVKLLATLGCLLGPVDILKVALAAALAGGIFALAVAAREQRLIATLRGIANLIGFWIRGGLHPSPELSLANPSTLKIPYAVPVAAGTLIVALGRWS